MFLFPLTRMQVLRAQGICLSQPLCFSSVHGIRHITEFHVCNTEGMRVALRWCMQIWVALWKSVESPWDITKESVLTFSSYPNWLKGCTHFVSTDSGVPGFFEWDFFFLLAMPWGMWDLSFLTSDWTCVPAVEMQSPNHWTAQEVPGVRFINRSWLTAFPLYPHLSPSLDFDHYEWEIPFWKIPWTEEPGRLQSMGLLRVGYNWATSLWLFPFMHWRRKWQPTPVFLPRESQGWGSLVGCRLWGRTESDTTEAT